MELSMLHPTLTHRILVQYVYFFFQPEWKIADPICTFFFSVMVLLTTINILRDAVNIMMEGR